MDPRSNVSHSLSLDGLLQLLGHIPAFCSLNLRIEVLYQLSSHPWGYLAGLCEGKEEGSCLYTALRMAGTPAPNWRRVTHCQQIHFAIWTDQFTFPSKHLKGRLKLGFRE